MSRGATLMELMVIVAILALVAAMAVPSYATFSRARAVNDAAATLAQDFSLFEREAQNDGVGSGITLYVITRDPFTYAAYRGSPESTAPPVSGELIVRRASSDVELVAGVIDVNAPLFFDANGGAIPTSTGTALTQHRTVQITLTSTANPGRTAAVQLNLFTGAVSTPNVAARSRARTQAFAEGAVRWF